MEFGRKINWQSKRVKLNGICAVHYCGLSTVQLQLLKKSWLWQYYSHNDTHWSPMATLAVDMWLQRGLKLKLLKEQFIKHGSSRIVGRREEWYRLRRQCPKCPLSLALLYYESVIMLLISLDLQPLLWVHSPSAYFPFVSYGPSGGESEGTAMGNRY